VSRAGTVRITRNRGVRDIPLASHVLQAVPPPLTPDKRYIIVDGVLWRASNPALSEERRAELVAELMSARRAVAAALKADDAAAEAAARARVQAAKVGLGERGPVWWDDGAPDYNRRKVEGTVYGGSEATATSTSART
jgi:hypothetical protein